eukprot:gene13963-15420_t
MSERDIVDDLISVTMYSSSGKCVCFYEENACKKTKRNGDVYGWRPVNTSSAACQTSTIITSRCNENRRNNVTSFIVPRKNNRGKQACRPGFPVAKSTSEPSQKSYFHNHKEKGEHIHHYRNEFSSIKLTSASDNNQWLDPYMPNKGDKKQLLMRIKLLETLSEMCSQETPEKDLPTKWKELPPIRRTRPPSPNLVSTVLRCHFKAENKPLLSTTDLSETRLKRSMWCDYKNINEVQPKVLGTKAHASYSESKGTSLKDCNCLKVQNEVLMKTRPLLEEDSPGNVAASNDDNDVVESKLANQWPDGRNIARINNYKMREGLTLFKSRNEVARKRASMTIAERRKTTNKPESTLVTTKEKSVHSIPYKKKGDPLYISILGKSPICRETYDSNN